MHFLLTLTPAEFGHSVLQDIGLICAAAALLAGLLHFYLRRAAPSLRWNERGNVDVSHFSAMDIIGVLLVTIPMTSSLMMPYKDNSGTEITVPMLVANFGLMLLMAGIVLAIYKGRRQLPGGLGLHPEHPLRVIAWAIAAYIAIFIVFIIITKCGLQEWLGERLGEKENQKIVDEMLTSDNNEKRLILILGACVIAPFAEEIIFRGYLYPVLKRFSEPVIAAILSGIIFGAIHGQIWAVVPLSLFGIMLAFLYEKSGSIWACILCHCLFNSINVFLMLTMGDKL